MNVTRVLVILLVLAALVVLAVSGRPRPVRRLATLQTRTTPAPPTTVNVVDPSRLVRRGSPALLGLAGWLVVGGWLGVVLGVLAGVTAGLILRRQSGNVAMGDRREAAADLPYGVDLLAAALRAGAPLDRALRVVGRALDGPLGRRFDEVGQALRLGVHGAEGWRAVADVPGSGALIAAAVRAAESGSTLAAACSRSATELRERRAAEADAAAQRAGVLIVLPLGACFLPAFVLVGVVPILLGVLDDVLA